MEDAMSRVSESVEELQKKFYGVVTGKVINPLDPLTLGRVQVQLPFIDDLDLSPWARVAVPMAGIGHGTYFIPNVGDEVLVAFEHGELNAPYVIGSLWNATAPPPFPSPVPQIRTIRTPIMNEIMFTEIPPTITIKTPATETIFMSPAGIQITAGANVINMTPDGITLTGANINIVGSAAINLNAPSISINGATTTNVQSGGMCKVTAPMVKIN
ncbi:MAG: phage baseplate assembly protein V [Gemmatimonadales bacterium]